MVGLGFALILISSYLLFADRASEHIQNLWSNLAIEVFGVWISVRIIDFLIQRHRSFRAIRFRLLDNLSHFDHIASYVLQYNSSHQRDIELLQREVVFFEKRWIKRQKYFYKDEQSIILSLFQKMPEIISTCVHIELVGDMPITKESALEWKGRLRNQLYEYRTELDSLRHNIWQESDPDD